MKYSLDPQFCPDGEAWYYESRRGLMVYHRMEDGDQVITASFLIPWRLVKGSFRRHVGDYIVQPKKPVPVVLQPWTDTGTATPQAHKRRKR